MTEQSDTIFFATIFREERSLRWCRFTNVGMEDWFQKLLRNQNWPLLFTVEGGEPNKNPFLDQNKNDNLLNLI